VLGLGQGENFVASDVPAILAHTREVIFLEEGDFAEVTATGVRLCDAYGDPVERKVQRVDWSPVQAEKGGHKHFMHKEIHEQARALIDTIRGRASVEEGDVFLDGCALDAARVAALSRITIVACGTSWHASLVGKMMIEQLARLPVEVDLASEFRYRDPLVDEKTLCIAVSQSGETADTLGAFREAKRRGARGLAICNVVGSAIAREADDVLHTHAGPEIGVASTKAFTTQLAALFLLAVRLGRLRGTLSAEAARAPARAAPRDAGAGRARAASRIGDQGGRAALVGRPRLPLPRPRPAVPGRARGSAQAQGDLVHPRRGLRRRRDEARPIALIDESMPVLVLAPRDPGAHPGAAYEKILATSRRSGRAAAR